MADRNRMSVGFCLMLTAMLMVLPFSWLVAMLVSAGIHEVGHYAAIRILTGKGSSVSSIRPDGAGIVMPEISGWKELVCALSGPVAGLCLLLAVRIMPRVAVCAAFHSVYNLIPIYPRDGGRAVRALLQVLISPKYAEGIFCCVEWVFIILLLLIAGYLTVFLHLGILPPMIVAWDLICTKKSLKTGGFRSTIVPSCE